MRIAVAALAALSAAALVAGCSSSGKPEVATSVSHASTSASGSPTSTAPAAPPDLKKVILGVGDLPTGWTTTAASTAVALSTVGCLKTASRTAKTKQSLTAHFAGSGGTPAYSQSLAYFPLATATTQYDDAVADIAACGTLTYKVGKIDFKGPIESTSFPTIGDESKAYTIAYTYGAYSLTEYVLVARQKTLVMLCTYAASKSNGGINDFLGLDQKAAAKLP